MAGFMSDEIYDAGLDYADTNGTRMDVTHTAEATTYSLATTDNVNSVGNKTGLNTGATADGPTDGRKVIVPAITDGTVTETATAGFWALTDGATLLVATGPLTATQAMTDGNTFSLDAVELRIRDATSV